MGEIISGIFYSFFNNLFLIIFFKNFLKLEFCIIFKRMKYDHAYLY